MSTSQPVERRGGLANVVDIIIAPIAAFDRIRQVPAWGWAFLVASLLAIAGAFLAAPAMQHALEISLPPILAANEQIAKLPPDQQQKQIAAIMGFTKIVSKFTWIIVPVVILLIGLVQGVIMLIANAATRGDGTFKKYFAVSITVTVVGVGVESLVRGAIVALRGADSFESSTAVQNALPGLALLAPSAKGALAGFLGAFNVFSLWATALLALGMKRVGRIPGGAAWGTAIVMLLLGACILAFNARNG